jgi:hypothetical protein
VAGQWISQDTLVFPKVANYIGLFICNLYDFIINDILKSENNLCHIHTCDRVAMLQLEICKFLAGDLVS